MVVVHTIEPVYDAASRVLILGSMPSPKSRETGFYYGHPRNRFWQVLAAVFGEETPRDNERKRAFVLARHIALWDVLASCEIEGASDASIKNPAPNDLRRILSFCPIRAVFTAGGTASRLYRRCFSGGPASIALPSTSPANCAYPLERLIREYAVVKAYLSD